MRTFVSENTTGRGDVAKAARPGTRWVRYGYVGALLLVMVFFAIVRVRLKWLRKNLVFGVLQSSATCFRARLWPRSSSGPAPRVVFAHTSAWVLPRRYQLHHAHQVVRRRREPKQPIDSAASA